MPERDMMYCETQSIHIPHTRGGYHVDGRRDYGTPLKSQWQLRQTTFAARRISDWPDIIIPGFHLRPSIHCLEVIGDGFCLC